MPELIIDLKYIAKIFNPGENEVRALQGINFKIFSNEFVALMGASGSGKSILLNILGCLDQPTEGDYLLKGEDVSLMAKSEISKIRSRNFGFVFQAYNLLPKTSAIEI